MMMMMMIIIIIIIIIINCNELVPKSVETEGKEPTSANLQNYS